MNSSISRLLVALPLSIVLSFGLALLGDSTADPLFVAGILYTIVVFSMMSYITIAKIVKTDQVDHNQLKLDLIFQAIQLTESKTPLIEEIEQEDIEFDYTKIAPERIPSPNVDKSLQF